MLECTADNIVQLHLDLSTEFKPYLHTNSRPTIIDGPANPNGNVWRARQYRGAVEFFLADSNWPAYSNTPRRRDSVVQLNGYDSDAEEMAWVAWRERWRKDKVDTRFVLCDIAFTFFWGRTYDVSQQIFRVEWQALEGTPPPSPMSAHPHWHLDHEPLGYQYEVGSFHFAMAGWQNSHEHPSCWQTYLTSIAELKNWAVKALQYSSEQFANYPPSPLVTEN